MTQNYSYFVGEFGKVHITGTFVGVWQTADLIQGDLLDSRHKDASIHNPTLMDMKPCILLECLGIMCIDVWPILLIYYDLVQGLSIQSSYLCFPVLRRTVFFMAIMNNTTNKITIHIVKSKHRKIKESETY